MVLADSGSTRAAGPATLSTNADMEGTLTLAPTADPRVLMAPDGSLLRPPTGWACLPPGDAGLTRRVKASGPSWSVLEKRGRKLFSKGLWAPEVNIEAARSAIAAERSTAGYTQKLAASRARRERAQATYVATFESEVLKFLRFAPVWLAAGHALARLVAEHATPVGSGTVARTERIPVAERAEAAVIAWMRHQTTAYDNLQIPRVAGKRREVRRALAQVSRAILDLHRKDAAHAIRVCPLCTALSQRSQASEP
jgi:Uncharacterized conserved protein (DUF2293)